MQAPHISVPVTACMWDSPNQLELQLLLPNSNDGINRPAATHLADTDEL